MKKINIFIYWLIWIWILWWLNVNAYTLEDLWITSPNKSNNFWLNYSLNYDYVDMSKVNWNTNTNKSNTSTSSSSSTKKTDVVNMSTVQWNNKWTDYVDMSKVSWNSYWAWSTVWTNVNTTNNLNSLLWDYLKSTSTNTTNKTNTSSTTNKNTSTKSVKDILDPIINNKASTTTKLRDVVTNQEDINTLRNNNCEWIAENAKYSTWYILVTDDEFQKITEWFKTIENAYEWKNNWKNAIISMYSKTYNNFYQQQQEFENQWWECNSLLSEKYKELLDIFSIHSSKYAWWVQKVLWTMSSNWQKYYSKNMTENHTNIIWKDIETIKDTWTVWINPWYRTKDESVKLFEDFHNFKFNNNTWIRWSVNETWSVAWINSYTSNLTAFLNYLNN